MSKRTLWMLENRFRADDGDWSPTRLFGWTMDADKLNRIARRVLAIRDHLDSDFGCDTCVRTVSLMEWVLSRVDAWRHLSDFELSEEEPAISSLFAALGLD